MGQPMKGISTRTAPALTIYYVEAVAVHDGDTFRVSLPMHALIPGATVGGWEEDVRLAHVNAPELRTPDGDNAQGQVNNWLLDPSRKNLSMSIWGRDKYGRLLADVAGSDGVTLSSFVASLPGSKPELVERQLGHE